MNASPSVECQIQLDYPRFFGDPSIGWRIFGDLTADSPVERLLKRFPPLRDHADVFGAATVAEAYDLKPLLVEAPQRWQGLPVVNSGTIDRYHFLWGAREMRYIKNSFLRPIVPAGQEHHLPPRRLQQARMQKLVMAGMTKRLEVAIDADGAWLAAKSTTIVIPRELSLFYLCGLMNSRLIDFIFRTMFAGNALQGGYLRIGPPQVEMLPVCAPDRTVEAERTRHDRVVGLVERMLQLHKDVTRARMPNEKATIERQIAATDREIDRLVYELYGLTAEEIRIVEGAAQG
jgi:hypothetical protein